MHQSHDSLAHRLRLETRSLHADAERAGVMGRLLRGQIDRPAYAAMLRNLHALYAALEDGLQHHADHPMLARINEPRLFRQEALAADLLVLHGAGWRRALPLAPSAAHYAEHLHEIARAQPELLVAHAYVRYLGDLHGGQLLKRLIADKLSLIDGLSFYDFGDAASVQSRIGAFRTGLASMALSERQADAIVLEAQRAFSRHIQLFEEVDAIGARASASHNTVRSRT